MRSLSALEAGTDSVVAMTKYSIVASMQMPLV